MGGRERSLLVFLTLTAIPYLAAVHPALNTEFVLVDDPMFIRWASPTQVHPQAEAPGTFWDYVSWGMPWGERFMPTRQIIQVSIAMVFGADAHWLHAFVVLMGLATAAFSFGAFRLLSFSPTVAALCTDLILLQPSAASNWSMITTGETFGMLFFSVALWCAGRGAADDRLRWRLLFGAALVLGATSKESFILGIPAMLLLWVALRARRAAMPLTPISRARLVGVILGGVTFAVLLLLAWHLKSQAGSEAYVNPPLPPDGWAGTIARMGQFVARNPELWLPVTLSGLFVVYRVPRYAARDAPGSIRIASVTLLGVLPQAALYATMGGFTAPYGLYPLAFFTGIASVFALGYLMRTGPRALRLLSLVIVCLLVIRCGRITNWYSQLSSTGSLALHAMLQRLAEDTPHGGTIGIALERGRLGSASVSSFNYLLGAMGRSDVGTVVVPLGSSWPRPPYEQRGANALLRRYEGRVLSPESLPRDLGAIVWLEPPAQLARVLGSGSWRAYTALAFSRVARQPSIRTLGFVEEARTYHLLVRSAPTSPPG